MAVIPDYTAVGEATPSPSYRRVQPDIAGKILEGGVENLAGGLQKVSDEDYTQNVNLARAQASNALLDHEIAVKTQAQQISQDVTDGKLPYAQAKQAYSDAVEKIGTPTVANLDPVGQENFQRGIQRNVATTGFAIDQTVQVAQKNDFRDQFASNLDKLGKLAGMPNADIDGINEKADAFRPLAQAAGLPAVDVDKAVQSFKDQNWFNQATQRSMEAKDNYGALRTLQHDLTDSNGAYAGKLDTNKRNEVLRSVINDQLILENRYQHEQDKREAHAQATVNQINEQVSSGIPATPGMWSKWEADTKGTAAEPEFKQALQDETTVQNVLRMPMGQQQQYVQDKTQQLETQGGTLHDRANIMRLQTAVNQNVNLMQKAPLLFSANRNGTEVAPLDFSKMNSPEGQQAVGQSIADRMATLGALKKQYGPQIGTMPLLPQEASQLASQLDNSTPKDRMGLLVSMRQSFGSDEAYQAVMHQIDQHSPVTAIVGQRMGQSAPASTPVWFDSKFTPTMQDGARVLRGDSLLNPNKAATGQQEKDEIKSTVPMPPEGTANMPGLRDRFASATGDLFRDRPDLGDSYYATFKAADASLRAEAGDFKGEPNTNIEKQALKIALGNTVKFNGSSVMVPPGMDPSKFTGLVNAAVGAVAKGAGAGPDWADRISGYQLHELGGVGTGRYAVMDGAIPFKRPDGKGPMIIDLRNQYLPSRVNGGAQAPATATIQ